MSVDSLWPLPEAWRWVSFRDVAEVRSDLRDPSASPDAIHIAPNHIESGTGRLLSRGTIAGDKVTSPKHAFHPGQILYSKIRPYLAKAVFVDFEGLCSADMYPVSAILDRIEPKFLHRWLVSPAFTDVARESQGRTVLPKINQDALYGKPVPVAPLPEQKRIADKVEALLARVDACRRRLDRVPAILKRFRQRVLASATSGALTREWREGRGLKRDGWRKATFEDVCVQITVGFVGTMADQYRAQGVPFLRSQNVRPFTFDRRELRYVSPEFHQSISKSILRPGDVVVVRTGAPGQCCVIPPDVVEANCSDLVIVRPAPELDSKFAVVFINSETSQSFVKSEQVGVAQSHFNVGSMKRAPIELPSVAEQREIARRIEELFNLTAHLELRLRAARSVIDTLTPSVLAKAFRGELVPQDPSDEPASALLERIRTHCVVPAATSKPMRIGATRPRTKVAADTDPRPAARKRRAS